MEFAQARKCSTGENIGGGGGDEEQLEGRMNFVPRIKHTPLIGDNNSKKLHHHTGDKARNPQLPFSPPQPLTTFNNSNYFRRERNEVK
jgi:hypothetical protein